MHIGQRIWLRQDSSLTSVSAKCVPEYLMKISVDFFNHIILTIKLTHLAPAYLSEIYIILLYIYWYSVAKNNILYRYSDHYMVYWPLLPHLTTTHLPSAGGFCVALVDLFSSLRISLLFSSLRRFLFFPFRCSSSPDRPTLTSKNKNNFSKRLQK